VIHTPSSPNDPHAAINAEILLQRVRFRDSNIGQSGTFVEVAANRLIFPSAIGGLEFQGGPGKFRITNGGVAPWSGVVPGTIGSGPNGAGMQFTSIVNDNRTQLFLEQAGSLAPNPAGNPNACESSDYAPFCQAILGCLRSNNLNYRVGLEQAPPSVSFTYTIEFESRIWDSHFLPDTRQELLFFEEQGNSILTIQAMEGDALIGNPVTVQSVTMIDVRNALMVSSTSPTATPTPITAQQGRVKLGKVSPNGTIDNQGTWAKFYAMDLNELGVPHLKKIRVRSAIGSSGGGNRSAHVKVMAVDTSPAYLAQTMSFD